MTVTQQAAECSTASGLRRAAMTFLASGRAPGGLRAKAADPLATARIAALTGISPADARDQMLAVAAVIELIEDEGMTAEQCYDTLGLADVIGPFGAELQEGGQ